MATTTSLKRQISSLLRDYTRAMDQGGVLLFQAVTARLEAEKARDDFREMKQEAYRLEGKSASTEVRYGGKAEPKAALADNRWFIDQHPGYGSEAGAYFAKATAIMASIQWLTMRLHHPTDPVED